MADRYGPLYKAADLIARALPKRGSGAFEDLVVHRFIEFLQALDAAQESNGFITFALQTGGSIRVLYRGSELFGLQPHTTHIRLGTRFEPITEDRKILLDTIANSEPLFQRRIESPLVFHAQWRCGKGELEVLERFVQDLPVMTAQDEVADISHPRHFSGAVRQKALEDFYRSGKFCPGVGVKRHKVDIEAGQRIEFDHVLPVSKGGSSSGGNIQVLCMECNRRKRDTAL